MNEFARFFAKVALLGALLAIGLWLVFYVVLPPDYSDTFAIMDRKIDALKNAQGPKIVLLGGSNVMMGVDSALLGQKLGRPVVDIAIQVSIPLATQINQIEPYLKPGDLVVMSVEYGSYVFPDGDVNILARQLEAYPAELFQLDSTNLGRLPAILKAMFQIKMNRLITQGGLRLASLNQILDPSSQLPHSLLDQFDAQGDFIAHLDQPTRPIVPKMVMGPNQVNPRFFDVLNDIDRRVRQKGATAILTFPSVRQSTCDASTAAFSRLHTLLPASVTAPIVGTPESYCFSDNLFFDTEYHLNRQGRQLRTEQMIRDLAPYVKQ